MTTTPGRIVALSAAETNQRKINAAIQQLLTRNGGQQVNAAVSVSSAYTALASDFTILVSGNTPVTLPSAVSAPGQLYCIKKADAAGTTTTIVATIDGVVNPTITVQNSAILIHSDGANWNAVVTPGGGAVLGTFAGQNYATPPVIGGTTPAAATFTTLGGTLNLNLGLAAAVATPAINIFSSGHAVAYDTRLVSTGGNGTAGGGTLVMDGAFEIVPQANSLMSALSTAQSAHGSTGGNQLYNNLINVSSDDADTGTTLTTSFSLGLYVQHAFGGANATGGREAFFSNLILTAATKANIAGANPNDFYTANSGQAQANFTDGGTLGGSEKGQMYGGNFLGVLSSSGANFATGFKGVAGVLAEAYMLTGSSSKLKACAILRYGNTDAVQGATYDAALMITAATGASAGGKNAILIGDMHGAQPLASTATILATTGTLTIANGIDLSGPTITGYAYKSNGFSVNGSGTVAAAFVAVGNGTSGGPTFTFSNDTTTGLYLAGAGVMGVTKTVALVQNGTSGAPTLTFSSDTTVGLYLPAAGVLGVSKALSIASATASTSATTGALTVVGGLGVGGSIYGGFVSATTAIGSYQLQLNATGTGATSWGFAILSPSGDLDLDEIGVAQRLHIAKGTGVVSVLSTTASTSTATGALVVAGGAGIGGKVFAASLDVANGAPSATAGITIGGAAAFKNSSGYLGMYDGGGSSLVFEAGTNGSDPTVYFSQTNFTFRGQSGGATMATLNASGFTTALIAGGAAASSSLTLESTSGAGTTDNIFFKTGSQLERLRIDSSGYITQGGFANVPIVGLGSLFQTITASNPFVGSFVQYGNNANDPSFVFYKTRGATPTTAGAVISNDWLGEIDFYGNDGTSANAACWINGRVDGTPTTGHVPGALDFYTRVAGGGALLRMTINSAGQVVVNNGVIGTPSIAFTGDLTSGLYFQAAGIVGVSKSLNVGTYATVGNGTSGAPSWTFANDITTGLYLAGAGVMGITKAVALVANGTSGAPTLMFASDTTVGLYLPAAGVLGVSKALGIAGTTASTSTTTGALTVAGGAGIAGALNAGSATLASPLPVASGGTAYTGGAWTSYTATITPNVGTITQAGSASYLQIGKIVLVTIQVSMTVTSGAPTSVTIALPVAPVRQVCLAGKETNVTGKMITMSVGTGGTAANVADYANGSVAGNGYQFVFSCSYEAL